MYSLAHNICWSSERNLLRIAFLTKTLDGPFGLKMLCTPDSINCIYQQSKERPMLGTQPTLTPEQSVWDLLCKTDTATAFRPKTLFSPKFHILRSTSTIKYRQPRYINRRRSSTYRLQNVLVCLYNTHIIFFNTTQNLGVVTEKRCAFSAVNLTSRFYSH
jgi:hypothetical protein